MREIPLTRGRIALVDDEDYAKLSQWRWCLNADKSGHETASAYINQKKVKMHRIIMGVTDQLICVDHIDGNPLNNQRSNLRLCSKAINNRNRKKIKVGHSIYKGVSWHKRIEKWSSQIALNKEKIHIGYYLTEKEAAIAYDKAAIKLFGEHARTNSTLHKIKGSCLAQAS
jgi:hypothetical protein